MFVINGAALNARMIMKDELVRIWKEATADLFYGRPGGAEKNCNK
jgi:hypothetical protein